MRNADKKYARERETKTADEELSWYKIRFVGACKKKNILWKKEGSENAYQLVRKWDSGWEIIPANEKAGQLMRKQDS